MQEVHNFDGKTVARIIVPSERGEENPLLIRFEFTDDTWFQLDLDTLEISS